MPRPDPDTVHDSLKWATYAQLQLLLENHGFAVNPGESEADLTEAVRVNVLDGTIPLEDLQLAVEL